jgi:predicted acyltransferase
MILSDPLVVDPASTPERTTPAVSLTPESVQPRPAGKRVIALDALRGFDMLCILGTDEFVPALQAALPCGLTNFLAAQFTHSEWAGLTFYDLLFPTFVFIAGTALIFSLSKIIAQQGTRAAYRRVVTRAVLLYALGLIFYISFLPLGTVRLLGVLQRIAICYLFTGLIYVRFKGRGLLAALVIALVGYWALMSFVRVPLHGIGNFKEGANLANYIDQKYLPLYKWDRDHDPEGLLSTLPAIGTCILGAFAGMLLKEERFDSKKKMLWLCAGGAAALLLGYLWAMQFPIIKKIWTSSYVLVSAGWSTLALALFYQVIERWNFKRWAQPFLWIGSNAILLYMGCTVLRVSTITGFAFGWLPAGYVIAPAAAMSIVIFAAHFLYQKKWFIRL